MVLCINIRTREYEKAEGSYVIACNVETMCV